MNLFIRLTKVVATLCLSVMLIWIVLYFIGIRINETESIPLGIYRTAKETIQAGDYVMLCPPQNNVFVEAKRRGYLTSGVCPGNFGYMMKKVFAVSGDVVQVDAKGVLVNGDFVRFSTPIKMDSIGQAMPELQLENYVLKQDEVLLMSDINAQSFDGRYFGLINKKQIESVIKPLFIWQ